MSEIFEIKIEIINMNDVDIVKTSEPLLEEVGINENNGSYTEK